MNYYKESYFDYKRYDKNNKIIVFDLESGKTRQRFERLAKELITDAKAFLKIE